MGAAAARRRRSRSISASRCCSRPSAEWTKKSGYSELAPSGTIAPLIWADKSIGAPMAAKNADRMVFVQQTFNEYPNYWVADKKFGGAKQVTDAQPDDLQGATPGARSS